MQGRTSKDSRCENAVIAMKISMKISLLGLGLIVTVLPTAVMLAFISLMGVDIDKVAAREFKNISLDSARQVAVDIRQMCDIIRLFDESYSQGVRSAVVSALEEFGPARLGSDEISVEAKNQYNPLQKIEARVKKFYFGDTHVDPFVPLDSPQNKLGSVLLRLKDNLKCDFTIFQKINDSKNMLRLCSTLNSEDASPSAMTYFPETGKSGDGNTAFSYVLSGRGYSGIMEVGLATLSANYFPIFDKNGEVIGAVFYGTRKNSIAELEKYLRSYNLSLNSNSRIWIIDNSNEKNPVIKTSLDNSFAGVPLSSDMLGGRKKYLYDALSKAKSLRSNEIVSENIADSGEGVPSGKRIITYTYYRPWNWVIGAISTADAYNGSLESISLQISRLKREIVGVGIFFTALALGLSWFFASKMARPLKLMTRVARAQARGDMQSAEDLLSNSSSAGRGGITDFIRLFDALLSMTRNISKIISSVKRTGEYTARRGMQISAAATRLESMSQAENDAITKVSKKGKQIALSYDSLNKTAKNSVRGVSKTLFRTRLANSSLNVLKQNCDILSGVSEKLIGQLDAITKNVGGITNVATAINNVSVKTNLLSLNASIEAERAGELGLGFAVVARRIRKLADQTSAASEKIEKNVRLMQSSVNSSVIEIDTFASKIRTSSRIILETAVSLSRVIGDVESLGPKFENISESIASLSQSARNISATMEEITSSTARSREKFAAFKSATSDLDLTSKVLISEVSRFRTRDSHAGEDKK